MVRLKVEVDDWDTGVSTELMLPCDIRNKIDTTHELQIIDWDGDFSVGYYDNVVELNNLIDEINNENSLMTLEMLIKILDASGCVELSNKDFVRKICSSDFMLEEITGVYEKTPEEKCACYLATKMMIPFAKNISYPILEKMQDEKNILWSTVWEYYEAMGFEKITIGKKIYAFHWGDAEE